MRSLVIMTDNVFVSLSEHRRAGALLGVLLWISQAVFGAFTPRVLGTVVILVIADWILGTIKAAVWKRVSETGGIQGLVKLVVYLALLALTSMFVQADLGQSWRVVGVMLTSLVAGAIIVTETISVLKHLRCFADHYNVRVPVLDLLLARLEKEADKLETTP